MISWAEQNWGQIKKNWTNKKQMKNHRKVNIHFTCKG